MSYTVKQVFIFILITIYNINNLNTQAMRLKDKYINIGNMCIIIIIILLGTNTMCFFAYFEYFLAAVAFLHTIIQCLEY